jgi:protein-disulfide isomerase
MSRLNAARLRTSAPLLACLLAILGSAAACAQPGTHASAASGSAAHASADSILARASQGRQKGAASATVTVVEISDFQCPYCRQFYQNTYHRFDSAYVKTGKVRMVYVNLPLPMHPQAFAAAKAAMCAGAQGHFWEMHDRLFGSQSEWNGQADAVQRFARMAVELHLDPAAFRDCVDNDRTSSLIVNDVMQAAGAGVNGTPAFVVNNQRLLNGAVPFEDLAQAVDQALAGTLAQPTPPAGAQPAPAPTPAPAPPPAP